MRAVLWVPFFVGVTIAVLGALMAVFATEVNRRRMRLWGQTESSDGYIRLLGVAIAIFGVIVAALSPILGR
jgi:hypothetical protein